MGRPQHAIEMPELSDLFSGEQDRDHITISDATDADDLTVLAFGRDNESLRLAACRLCTILHEATASRGMQTHYRQGKTGLFVGIYGGESEGAKQ
eukprot:1443649-Pyramimonas_sp.AAC.1